jgi:ubiquitin-like modifier-activating enzyme 5
MDENRYTRLKALNDFGYEITWDDLKRKKIAIIGIGGLGTVSSEMVTRCGVGKIVLFDFDTVEAVNLNRSMFKPIHIGKSKAEIASKILNEINPDVKITYFIKDIMDIDFEFTFEKELSKMDIVLNGLDNLPAREYLNNKCINLRVPYIDAGASRSGLSGYVHPVIPYKTACAQCIKSIAVNLPEERGESCVASLPTTMAILASIQVQEMLKFLLKFGEMIDYLMYHMITGEFIHYSTKKDKNCPICGTRKREENDVKAKVTDKDIDDMIKKID